MRKQLVILLVLMLAIGGWAGWHHLAFERSKISHRVNGASYESDMTEGLLRYIVRESSANGVSAYFVGFGDYLTPPSRQFIARFQDVQPQVKSFNSSVHAPVGKILETSSGHIGVIIQIVAFKEVLPGVFDVTVGFSNLPDHANRFVYRVANEGVWTIRSRKPA